MFVFFNSKLTANIHCLLLESRFRYTHDINAVKLNNGEPLTFLFAEKKHKNSLGNLKASLGESGKTHGNLFSELQNGTDQN